MYNLPKISEPVEKLERLVRKERDAQIQRRFHMLLLLKSGEAESRSAAAQHLGVHRNTIADWLDLYEEGGLENLQQIGTPGPEPGQQSIPPEAMEALKNRLADPEGFSSYTEVRQWLAEEQDVDLCYSTVHGIVRYELGANLNSPSPQSSEKASESR